jgi:DNA-binding GntR family transcriptional regulator
MHKWQHIYNDLKDQIISGVFPPGSTLPSESEMTKKYGVTHQTVRRAIVELRIGGWVQPLQGKGVYVLDPRNPEPIL